MNPNDLVELLKQYNQLLMEYLVNKTLKGGASAALREELRQSRDDLRDMLLEQLTEQLSNTGTQSSSDPDL